MGLGWTERRPFVSASLTPRSKHGTWSWPVFPGDAGQEALAPSLSFPFCEVSVGLDAHVGS